MTPSPDDQARHQQLRMQRFGLGAIASLVTVFFAALLAWSGYLGREPASIYTGLVAACVVTFYVLFKSGANLRFQDPTLTVPQLVAAGLAITYLVYETGSVRAVAMAMYLMAFLFAVFTLNVRGMIKIAAFYVACYAAAVGVTALLHPEAIDGRREIVRAAGFTMLLVWITFLGGHVNGLREHLRETNRRLNLALEQSSRMAAYDELTGLPNARLFAKELARAIAEAQRTQTSFALLYCDLDGFKPVNDALGHAAGDALLREVAARLHATMREADLVARIGGDEFVVLASTCRSGEDARLLAERIRVALEAPFPIDGTEARISCSCGIALHPDHGIAGDMLLQAADRAMYVAKRAGRARYAMAAPLQVTSGR